MSTIDIYLNSIQSSQNYDFSLVSYKMYCEALDLSLSNTLTEDYFLNCLSEGILDDIKRMRLSKALVKVFRDLRSVLTSIGREFKLNLKDIVTAFKQREVFNMLRGFGFNIKLMIRCLNELTIAFEKGLLTIFKELFRLRIFQKLRSGAIKIDEVLETYPKLTKITGFVIAGLLLFIWLNMTFIGSFDYDFNFSNIAGALRGTFSIADLFVSPEGLMLVALFGTGSILGISAPWLGKSLYNLVMAIMYTGYIKSKEVDLKRFAKKIRAKLKRKRI